MGRSVGQFFLPGRSPSEIVNAANAFAAARGMKVVQAEPGSVVFAKGSKFWTWRRVLHVGATQVPGGTHVLVEAWAETLMIPELNANPTEFLGLVPRRSVNALASDLLTSLGIHGGQAVFQHY